MARRCKGFDQTVWDGKVNEVAEEVLWYKFGSDDDLEKLLLHTGDAGIAYENDPRVYFPNAWHGQNILGNAFAAGLAAVRDRLRKDSNKRLA